MKLILASGSKNRIQALTYARILFESVPAAIDEKSIRHDSIQEQVIAIAQAKVDKISQTHKGLILGADGTNIVDGVAFEKPESREEAIEMIQKQIGKVSEFVTGFYLKNTETDTSYSGVGHSTYTFRDLTRSEIEEYVDNEPVETWAAAFSPINSSALRFVEFISGSLSNYCYSMPFEELIPLFKKEKVL